MIWTTHNIIFKKKKPSSITKIMIPGGHVAVQILQVKYTVILQLLLKQESVQGSP